MVDVDGKSVDEELSELVSPIVVLGLTVFVVGDGGDGVMGAESNVTLFPVLGTTFGVDGVFVTVAVALVAVVLEEEEEDDDDEGQSFQFKDADGYHNITGENLQDSPSQLGGYDAIHGEPDTGINLPGSAQQTHTSPTAKKKKKDKNRKKKAKKAKKAEKEGAHNVEVLQTFSFGNKSPTNGDTSESISFPLETIDITVPEDIDLSSFTTESESAPRSSFGNESGLAAPKLSVNMKHWSFASSDPDTNPANQITRQVAEEPSHKKKKWKLFGNKAAKKEAAENIVNPQRLTTFDLAFATEELPMAFVQDDDTDSYRNSTINAWGEHN
eukprot:m.197077 g.197077  ORF g.197077 m.197077 type:complete len:327 (-) comp15707_c0_seq5:1269-2249(-)